MSLWPSRVRGGSDFEQFVASSKRLEEETEALVNEILECVYRKAAGTINVHHTDRIRGLKKDTGVVTRDVVEWYYGISETSKNEASYHQNMDPFLTDCPNKPSPLNTPQKSRLAEIIACAIKCYEHRDTNRTFPLWSLEFMHLKDFIVLQYPDPANRTPEEQGIFDLAGKESTDEREVRTLVDHLRNTLTKLNDEILRETEENRRQTNSGTRSSSVASSTSIGGGVAGVIETGAIDRKAVKKGTRLFSEDRTLLISMSDSGKRVIEDAAQIEAAGAEVSKCMKSAIDFESAKGQLLRMLRFLDECSAHVNYIGNIMPHLAIQNQELKNEIENWWTNKVLQTYSKAWTQTLLAWKECYGREPESIVPLPVTNLQQEVARYSAITQLLDKVNESTTRPKKSDHVALRIVRALEGYATKHINFLRAQGVNHNYSRDREYIWQQYFEVQTGVHHGDVSQADMALWSICRLTMQIDTEHVFLLREMEALSTILVQCIYEKDAEDRISFLNVTEMDEMKMIVRRLARERWRCKEQEVKSRLLLKQARCALRVCAKICQERWADRDALGETVWRLEEGSGNSVLDALDSAFKVLKGRLSAPVDTRQIALAQLTKAHSMFQKMFQKIVSDHGPTTGSSDEFFLRRLWAFREGVDAMSTYFKKVLPIYHEGKTYGGQVSQLDELRDKFREIYENLKETVSNLFYDEPRSFTGTVYQLLYDVYQYLVIHEIEHCTKYMSNVNPLLEILDAVQDIKAICEDTTASQPPSVHSLESMYECMDNCNKLVGTATRLVTNYHGTLPPAEEEECHAAVSMAARCLAERLALLQAFEHVLVKEDAPTRMLEAYRIFLRDAVTFRSQCSSFVPGVLPSTVQKQDVDACNTKVEKSMSSFKKIIEDVFQLNGVAVTRTGSPEKDKLDELRQDIRFFCNWAEARVPRRERLNARNDQITRTAQAIERTQDRHEWCRFLKESRKRARRSHKRSVDRDEEKVMAAFDAWQDAKFERTCRVQESLGEMRMTTKNAHSYLHHNAVVCTSLIQEMDAVSLYMMAATGSARFQADVHVECESAAEDLFQEMLRSVSMGRSWVSESVKKFNTSIPPSYPKVETVPQRLAQFSEILLPEWNASRNAQLFPREDEITHDVLKVSVLKEGGHEVGRALLMDRDKLLDALRKVSDPWKLHHRHDHEKVPEMVMDTLAMLPLEKTTVLNSKKLLMFRLRFARVSALKEVATRARAFESTIRTAVRRIILTHADMPAALKQEVEDVILDAHKHHFRVVETVRQSDPVLAPLLNDLQLQLRTRCLGKSVASPRDQNAIHRQLFDTALQEWYSKSGVTYSVFSHKGPSFAKQAAERKTPLQTLARTLVSEAESLLTGGLVWWELTTYVTHSSKTAPPPAVLKDAVLTFSKSLDAFQAVCVRCRAPARLQSELKAVPRKKGVITSREWKKTVVSPLEEACALIDSEMHAVMDPDSGKILPLSFVFADPGLTSESASLFGRKGEHDPLAQVTRAVRSIAFNMGHAHFLSNVNGSLPFVRNAAKINADAERWIEETMGPPTSKLHRRALAMLHVVRVPTVAGADGVEDAALAVHASSGCPKSIEQVLGDYQEDLRKWEEHLRVKYEELHEAETLEDEAALAAEEAGGGDDEEATGRSFWVHLVPAVAGRTAEGLVEASEQRNDVLLRLKGVDDAMELRAALTSDESMVPVDVAARRKWEQDTKSLAVKEAMVAMMAADMGPHTCFQEDEPKSEALARDRCLKLFSFRARVVSEYEGGHPGATDAAAVIDPDDPDACIHRCLDSFLVSEARYRVDRLVAEAGKKSSLGCVLEAGILRPPPASERRASSLKALMMPSSAAALAQDASWNTASYIGGSVFLTLAALTSPSIFETFFGRNSSGLAFVAVVAAAVAAFVAVLHQMTAADAPVPFKYGHYGMLFTVVACLTVGLAVAQVTLTKLKTPLEKRRKFSRDVAWILVLVALLVSVGIMGGVMLVVLNFSKP
jgi:hypothetical protein